MASETEASCIADPNFAVICSFLERFAESCGILHPNFTELQDMLENCEEVDAQLVELHVKLLRKARKSVSAEKWERALIKFGHTISAQDGWEVEKFGYIKTALATKLRLLKGLLEAQFDLNARFKSAVNKLTASELRTSPLGRDNQGQVYWCQQDASLNIRIYKEDEDDETWTLISKDRDGLAQLISTLGGDLTLADLEADDGEDELTSTNSQDDEAEDILLDTGQPEDAQPPGSEEEEEKEGATNGEEAKTEATNGEEKKVATDNKEAQQTSTTNGNTAENTSEPSSSVTETTTEPIKTEEEKPAVNLTIPSLMSGIKRKLEETAELEQNKKSKSEEVSDAIEDPPVLVQGEGSGADCNDEPEFGEAIEEPLMFVSGTGAGVECDTGNPGDKEGEKQQAANDNKTTEKNEGKEGSSTETTPPKRTSRWDNTNISPKAKQGPSSASGMVSEWVRDGERPDDKPEESTTSKPSILSPNKSSLWSIDQICGQTSSQPQPSIFKSGMFFGNLSKPSFSSSPERNRSTDSPKQDSNESTQSEGKKVEEEKESSNGKSDSKPSTPPKQETSSKEAKVDTVKVDQKIESGPSNIKKDSNITTKIESTKKEDSSPLKEKEAKTDITIPSSKLSSTSSSSSTEPKLSKEPVTSTGIKTTDKESIKPTKETEIKSSGAIKESKSDVKSSEKQSGAMDFSKKESAIKIPTPQSPTVSHVETSKVSDKVEKVQTVVKESKVEEMKKVSEDKKSDSVQSSVSKPTEKVESAQDRVTLKIPEIRVSQATSSHMKPKSPIEEIKQKIQPAFVPSKEKSPIPKEVERKPSEPTVTKVPTMFKPSELQMKSDVAGKSEATTSKLAPISLQGDKPEDKSAKPSNDEKEKTIEERKEVKESLIVKTIAPADLTIKDAPKVVEDLSKPTVPKEDKLSASIPKHQDKPSLSSAQKSTIVTETPAIPAKTHDQEKVKEKIISPAKSETEKPKEIISVDKTPAMASTSKQAEISATSEVTTKAMEMDTLKPSSGASEKPPSPSMRLSPTAQKSGRRKSLEAISLGIMKERMKSEPESSINMASSSSEVSPSKFTEEPKYVHKKFSPPEEKRGGDVVVNRNISTAKSYLDKKFEMKVCNFESVPKPYDIGDKVCFSNKMSDNIECKVSEDVEKSGDKNVTDNKGASTSKIIENKVAEKTIKTTEEIQKPIESNVISPEKSKPGSSNAEESNIKITEKVVDKPKLLIHDKKISEKVSDKSQVLKIEDKKVETVTDKPVSIKPQVKAPTVQAESLKPNEKPQSSKQDDKKAPVILPVKPVSATLEENKIQSSEKIVDLSKEKIFSEKAETSKPAEIKIPDKVVEKPVENKSNTPEKIEEKAKTSKPEMEISEMSIEKPVENKSKIPDKVVEKPVETSGKSKTSAPEESKSEKLAEKPAEKPVESKSKVPERLTEKPRNSKPEENKSKIPDKPLDKPEDKKSKVPEKPGNSKPEENKAKIPDKPLDKPEDKKSKVHEKLAEKPGSSKPEENKAKIPDKPLDKPEDKKSKVPEKLAEKPGSSKPEEIKSKIPDKPLDKPEDKKSKVPEKLADKPGSSKPEEIKSKIPDKPLDKPEDKKSKVPEKLADKPGSSKPDEIKSKIPDKPVGKPEDKKSKVHEKLAEKPGSSKPDEIKSKIPDKPVGKPEDKKSRVHEKLAEKPGSSKPEEIKSKIPDKPEDKKSKVPEKLAEQVGSSKAEETKAKIPDKSLVKPEEKTTESSKLEEYKLKTPEKKVAEKKEETKLKTPEKTEDKPKEKEVKFSEKVAEKPESSKVEEKFPAKPVTAKSETKKTIAESTVKSEDTKNEEVKEKPKSLRSEAKKTEEVKEKTEVLKPEEKKVEEVKQKAKGSKPEAKKTEEKPETSKIEEKKAEVKEEDSSKQEAPVEIKERITRKRGAKITEKATASTEEPEEKVAEVNDKTKKKIGLDKKKGSSKKDDSPPPDLSKEVEESPPDIVDKELSTDTKPSKESEMPKLEKEKSVDDSDKNDEPPVLEAAEKPVTIGSALAFDYNPPPSPQSSDDDHNADSSLVIDEMEEKSSRPQRAFRGRGRPPKRGRQPDVIPGAKQEETKSVAVRGRGRGRSGKARGVEALIGRAESSTPSTDAASPIDLGPVRMSRRIAQIKQKEEEDRRIAEEKALAEMQKKREEERRLQALKPLKADSSSSEEQESSDTDSEKAENGSVKKKRKYKKRQTKDEDYIGVADEDIQSRRKKKKKRRKKKRSGKGGKNPWESSGSSDSSSNQSEELGDMVEEEEEEEPATLKSDHEFSPESDLELGPGEQAVPARRARTARRVSTDKTPKAAKEEEEEDIYKCQKCSAGDRPETILLCDTCDQGWHTSCLKPEIHLVPEGDWFCPPCAHKHLVTALTSTLKELDRSVRKMHNQELRRQRLAYVGISLDNVLPVRGEEEDDDAEDPLQGGGSAASDDDNLRDAIKRGSGESESESSSGSATSSSSEESDKYPLRQRRAAATVNYNFTEYDELIKSAIQDEVDAVKGAGNLGRGKDISTIVNAQQQEEAEAGEKPEVEGGEAPKEKDKEKEEKGEDDDEESSSEESDDDKKSDDEEDEERARQHAALVKMSQRKKTRSLANLDISSEEDHASDEDFHGSSEFDEEEEDGSVDSDDSIAYKRRSSGPVRRSTRARQTRYDKAFINDSEDSEDEKKKKKHARSRGWLGDSDEAIDDSDLDSESGESDWNSKKGKKRKPAARSRAPAKRRRRSGGGGRRRRRGKGRGSRAPAKKRPAPAGSGNEEGEAPTPKPKKIKPPRPTPPPSPDEPVRRATRGRKINYQEIIGSDSDDAVPTRGKGRRIISDDEDEFRPEEEETDAVVAGTSSAPQAPVLDTSIPDPQATPTDIAPVPVTAATLQTMGGVMPQIVEVGRESENTDEDEEDEEQGMPKLPPTLAPMPAAIASVPPQILTPVITPPKTRGAGVRRGRGRGRGRPPTIPVMGRMMTKVTVSSPSQDESESDDDIPTTIGSRPIKSDQEPRVPPSLEDKVPPGYPGPQYPPQQQQQPTGGVISRLLQAPPIPPTTSQPFTAAAAASIAAKFYPNSPGNPQSYPPPRAPVRYPQASPINYRPPMRLRGGPPNVGMTYPPPSMLDNEKSITPPPPAYVTRPVGPIRPGFPTQRPPFQPPPPYQTNPQAPYYNPYPVDDTGPQQFQPPYQPPDTFTNPAVQDPNAVYEPPRPEGVIVGGGGGGGGEEGGEFGGLVSYFSSQREDDLES